MAKVQDTTNQVSEQDGVTIDRLPRIQSYPGTPATHRQLSHVMQVGVGPKTLQEENIQKLKKEFLEENRAVNETNYNCLLDEFKKEILPIYTEAQCERKVRKVRQDEHFCREKADSLKAEIGSLKRKLEESEEKRKKLKKKVDEYIKQKDIFRSSVESDNSADD